MAQRFRNSVAKPASGPEYSVAGHRVRRHEMGVRRQVRAHGLDHRDLGRADIGDDGARREVRGDGRRHLAHRADGRAEDDEAGAGDGGFDRLGDRVGEADLASARAHGGVDIGADHRAGDALPPRRAAQRGADQAEADDRDLGEERRGQRGTESVRHA